jgi:hypothetical protein
VLRKRCEYSLVSMEQWTELLAAVPVVVPSSR